MGSCQIWFELVQIIHAETFLESTMPVFYILAQDLLDSFDRLFIESISEKLLIAYSHLAI